MPMNVICGELNIKPEDILDNEGPVAAIIHSLDRSILLLQQ